MLRKTCINPYYIGVKSTLAVKMKIIRASPRECKGQCKNVLWELSSFML